jgi:SAM-dependent methyltransferase
MSLEEIFVARSAYLEKLRPYLSGNAQVEEVDGIPVAKIDKWSPGLRANAHYFNHPKWMENWLRCVHRNDALRERWRAASGSWDAKVVVDVGCGPGNLFQNVGGMPAFLIGIDVAPTCLKLAARLGYIPLLADAHAIPLRTAIADVVALNATLHHCDDMRKVIAECARLVKPGGVIVIDHDPQMSAWNFRGIGMLLWRLRKPIYRLLGRGGHRTEDDEQRWADATEIHHRPGDGLSESFLRSALETENFAVRVFPHNQTVGREILNGEMGRKHLKYRLIQRLSGINPNAVEAALSLLCVGLRREMQTDPSLTIV